MQKKEVKQEYLAVVSLLQRSTGLSSSLISRQLHTTAQLLKNEKSPENTPSNPPPPPDGDKRKQNNNEEDPDKKGDGNEKVMSVLTKAVLWMATIYILTLILTMALPQKNRPETSTRYVSWHEFVHHMLATGEVRELIIRPDMEMVTVILHDGAVVKGRQYSATVFHMAVADTARFEQKLREVEKRLGVIDGVTVTYDRNSDLAPKIVITLVVAAVMFSLLSRMKGMKSPISMDSFVSVT